MISMIVRQHAAINQRAQGTTPAKDRLECEEKPDQYAKCDVILSECKESFNEKILHCVQDNEVRGYRGGGGVA